jgi:hypothetical protein
MSSINTEKSFANAIDMVTDSADSWYENEYKASSEKLYETFSRLYQIRKAYFDDSSKKQGTCRVKILKEKCLARGCKFKSKSPSIAEMLIKLAFYKPKAEKRVSGYLRAFSILLTDEDVNETNVVDYIRAKGGIEELRREATKQTVSLKERVAIAERRVRELEDLCSFRTEQSEQNAANKGDIVIAIGVQTAKGAVAIKELVFEKNGKLSGKTAIEAALRSFYSISRKQDESEKKANEIVKESDEQEAIIDAALISDDGMQEAEVA